MGKLKGAAGVQNRHMYSRISYLHQAASYLATSQATKATGGESKQKDDSSNYNKNHEMVTQRMARRLLSDMRAISHKTQTRVAASLKQTVCKSCDTLLVEGETCTATVENPSRWSKKPWADLLVRRCNSCGFVKRYPIQAPRQKRSVLRKREAAGSEFGLQKPTSGHNKTKGLTGIEPRT